MLELFSKILLLFFFFFDYIFRIYSLNILLSAFLLQKVIFLFFFYKLKVLIKFQNQIKSQYFEA